MTPTPFRNNLQKNDRVLDTVSGRQGKVKWNPREHGRRTAIQIDGTATPRYLDVMTLRLIANGHTPEESAPVEGEPPAIEPERSEPQTPCGKGALEMLRNELGQNERRMKDAEQTFRTLKKENARIERAILALTTDPE